MSPSATQVTKLYVKEQCVKELCVTKLRVRELCVKEVCVCTICIDVKLHITAGGCWGTLQSAANEDAAMFL